VKVSTVLPISSDIVAYGDQYQSATKTASSGFV